MLDPTDKCEKGACGCPHQSSNLIHNGLLCPPHLPSALSWALHRVGIVLNRLLNSLDSQNRGRNKLGQKTATATLPQPGQVELSRTMARTAVRLQQAMKCNYRLKTYVHGEFLMYLK